MRAGWNVTQGIAARSTGGVIAEAEPFVFDRGPPRRKITSVVTVAGKGDMMVLSDIQGIGIVSAIVRIVAYWLHSQEVTSGDHSGGVRHWCAGEMGD
jgi:hypothetical protein